MGLFRGYNDHTVVFHHAMSFGMMAYVMWYGRYGDELAFGLLQGEITNAILSTSDILDIYDKFYGVQIALKLIFMGSFIGIRTIISYPYIVKIQTLSNDPFFIIFPTSVWIISMHWVWAMFQKSSKIASQVKTIFKFYSL